MAITNCPSCSKPISDKAKSCPHCSFDFGDATADDIRRKLSLQRFQKVQKIQNQSMLAIILFVVGCFLIFQGNFPAGETGVLMWNGSIALATLGFIWYAVNRVRITLAKRG
jgi:hypothetical protein